MSSTHNTDGTLKPVSLQEAMRHSIFPKHTPKKRVRDTLEALAEEDYLIDFEMEANGYLVHLGPTKPTTYLCDILNQNLDEAEKESGQDAAPPDQKIIALSFKTRDPFLHDAGNPCQCPYSHSARCPLNMETRGELGIKQQITRGNVSPMCAQC